MPNPGSLKIGDYVRFVALPDEWSSPGYVVPAYTLAFMKVMIGRRWASRVYEVDELGPWIMARVRQRGKLRYHCWLISESTGWRVVKHGV